MCWTCKATPIEQIAHEDFIVYKTLVHGRSKYYNYPYTLGKLETLPEDIEIIEGRDYFEITKGFHSYRINKATRVANCYRLYFNNGFTDWYVDTINFSEPLELYECTIPKGSIYYDDGFGEIVSNQIIVNKLMDIKILLSPRERAKLM